MRYYWHMTYIVKHRYCTMTRIIVHTIYIYTHILSIKDDQVSYQRQDRQGRVRPWAWRSGPSGKRWELLVCWARSWKILSSTVPKILKYFEISWITVGLSDLWHLCRVNVVTSTLVLIRPRLVLSHPMRRLKVRPQREPLHISRYAGCPHATATQA